MVASAILLWATLSAVSTARISARGSAARTLDVAKLAVGVSDQVVEQVVCQGAGGLGFDAGLLAQGVDLAVGHHGGQLDEQAATALAVFVLAVLEDALQGGRGQVVLGPMYFSICR